MDQQQRYSIFLIASYTRSIFSNKGPDINIPLDIINMIFRYFHLRFHFDIIPKIKRCGKANMLNHLGEHYDNYIQAVIVTIDSECIYVGFAGNDTPTLAVPNIISMRNHNTNNIIYGHQLDDVKCNLSAAIRPVQYGEIQHYEAMKQILLQIFSKVPKDEILHLLLSESVPFTNRQEITRFAFDELKCKKFSLIPRSVLSLYSSSGISTGVVILSDYECTDIVPLFDRSSVKSACKKIYFGKRDIIDYLDKIKFNGNDNDNDNVNKNDDGMMLFFSKANVHNEIVECITKCDIFINNKNMGSTSAGSCVKDYYRNIILSGINTMYDGFVDQLQKQLSTLVPLDYNVKVVAPPEREYSSWIGGSIIASISTFEAMWITKDEYDKVGPSIIDAKTYF